MTTTPGLTSSSQSSPASPAASAPADAAGESPLLRGLTESQREAVLHGEGPMLVLAAAGSGKTTVITRRVAMLIARGAPPWSILALTFTNKAATEMRERIERQLPPEYGGRGGGAARGLTVTTFHSFCARLLRRYGEEVGLSPDYSIYDSADQKTAVKQAVEQLSLSSSNFKADAVLSTISAAKNRLEGPAEFGRNAGDFWERSVAKIYERYAKILSAASAVDFDDLLLYVAKLLRERENVRHELQQRFRSILIDEYQDTNHAQFIIAHTLASAHRNIVVVGDPDQSIYAWRGADISNILEFEEHYPDAKIVKLGENFRSTGPILRLADYLIKHNRQRHDKPLFTTTRETGPKPVCVACIDERHEAAMVVRYFKKLSEERDLAWKDMAVFYRTNALSRVLEGELRDAGIPYTIVRGTAFYQRKEIKDALAYLRLALNSQDEVALRRIVNTPARGIGKTTIERLEVFAIDRGLDLFSAMERVREITDLSARAIGAVEGFVRMIRKWRDSGSYLGAEVTGELAEFVTRVIAETGMEAAYRKSGTDEDFERIENLSELISSAAEFELEYELTGDAMDIDPFAPAPAEGDASALPPENEPSLFAKLREYLNHVSLVADADAIDPESGAVTMMTLHAAKGLEFPAVAMVGLEEGVLPHSRARDNESDLEEERRLCFVGITRAQSWIMLTSAQTRTIRGIPERTIASRFLDQLPEEEIEWIGDRRSGPGRDYGGADSDDAQEHDPPMAETREIGRWRQELLGGARATATARSDASPNSYNASAGRAAGSSSGAGESAYPVGCRVAHPQFGYGIVENVARSGQHTRMRIRFESAGVKTLVAQYARLQRVR